MKIKKVLGVVLILGMLVSCVNLMSGDSGSEEEPEKDLVVAEVRQPERVEKEESPEVVEKKTVEKEDKELVERGMAEAYLGIMRDNLSSLARVELEWEDDVAVYYVHPTDPSLEDVVMYVLLGDREVIEAWQYMTRNLVEMSDVMTGGLSYNMIAFTNPQDTELILFSTMNGMVLYDFMHD